jgi:peptide-methionine (S)-S-oxide reductase
MSEPHTNTSQNNPSSDKRSILRGEIAVFGGGCFWCTEAIFQRVRGVLSIMSGYAGASDHIEVIYLEYDPQQITYTDLLDIFWHIHDPTSMDQQGANKGIKYRSVIFATTAQQLQLAQESKGEIEHSHEFSDPIVTQIRLLDKFVTAEEVHQNFYNDNPDHPFCTFVIEPKLKKFLEKYQQYATSPTQ